MTEGYSLSDVAAVTRNNNDGWGMDGGGFFWIFALLLLPMLSGGGFWGNNRGEAVTESGLCNAMNFNNLENAVGRLSDRQLEQFTSLTNGICNLGYEQLRNTNALAMQSAQQTNDTQRQLADCCCTTQRAIDGVNFNAAMNTAAINANTTAQTQKILDVLCENKIEALQNQVNALQLQNAVAGVVRYPNSTTFTAGFNPFFNNSCCGCGNGNI
ncbi:MAG: hypothetical protein J1F01_08605 [Oscillospiraceae bacterium]|nr:hypothetical protein [Oscillospiraceae bacterium]